MRFNEVNKVIIETMNRGEARAFIKFLTSEIARHEMDIENAQELIQQVRNRFGLCE